MAGELRWRGPYALDARDGCALGRIVSVWCGLGSPSFKPNPELAANLGIDFEEDSFSSAQRRASAAYRNRRMDR